MPVKAGTARKTETNWREAEKRIWRPPERLTVSQWAEKYRVLVEPAEEKGPLRIRRTPYLAPIIDGCLDPHVERIVFCKAAQIAGTEGMISLIGYFAHQDPSSIMLVLADEDTALYMSKERIQKMFRASRELSTLIIEERFNQKEIALLNGAYIALAWASSVARLASRPMRIVIFDEVDKPGYFVNTREASPISLGIERTETFFNRKILELSTPTTEDGNIWRDLNSCDAIHDWHVPCPHCQTFQPLRWNPKHATGFPDGTYRSENGVRLPLGGVVWEGSTRANRKQIEAAGYACGRCGSIWTTIEKNRAVEKGRMVPREQVNHPPRKIGFHVNRLYSLLGKSGDIPKLVDDWIRAHKSDDPRALQGFINSALAEPWEEIFTEKKDPSQAMQEHLIPDLPPGTIPEEAICLTMGIDTQAAGFWWVARAWAPNKTSFLVDYGFAPSLAELEDIIFERAWPITRTENRMSVWRAAIDTGGTKIDGISMTEKVYNWLRERSQGRVFGVKGMSTTKAHRVQRSILDKLPNGKKIPGGLVLYLINTEAFKETIHYRLSLEPKENGAFFVHQETTEEYFQQLLSEYKRKNMRTGKVEWVKKTGAENHLLDAEVYCAATVDAEWEGGLRMFKRFQERKKNQRPRGVISKGIKI